MLDVFINDILSLDNPAMFANLWEAMFAIALSFLLGVIISWSYSKTCNGNYPSQAFMHALIIMTVVIAVVIIAVGSNIARAFSLAGALSIIRFRSTVHGPKDVAFIFFAMGSGLAVGTGLYLLAVTFTVLLCALTIGLSAIDYGGAGETRTLKITVPENMAHAGLFEKLFAECLAQYKMASIRTIRQGTMFELVYQVTLKNGVNEKTLIDGIRIINGNLGVTLLLVPND